MGLHLMYVKHWTGDLKNIGVHEILAKDLGWEAYLAQCLHTIQCMQEPQVGKKKKTTIIPLTSSLSTSSTAVNLTSPFSYYVASQVVTDRSFILIPLRL